MVRLRTPMWPDMRLPLNTRPGVWRWPIEPGCAVRDRVAVGLHAAREVVALHGAGKALADRGAGDVDDLARREHVDLELAAQPSASPSPLLQAEFLGGVAGGDIGLGEMAGKRLGHTRGAAGPTVT
jgi:hypothetical protein